MLLGKDCFNQENSGDDDELGDCDDEDDVLVVAVGVVTWGDWSDARVCDDCDCDCDCDCGCGVDGRTEAVVTSVVRVVWTLWKGAPLPLPLPLPLAWLV